jgi:hypothetical protein
VVQAERPAFGPALGLKRGPCGEDLLVKCDTPDPHSAAAARGLTRFVGRETEVEQLRQALARTVAGHGQVVAIVGDVGVGKSRLVWELTHSHRTHGWLMLEAGAVSHGRATPYRPIVDLPKGYCQIEDRDDHRKVRQKVGGKLLTLDEALRPVGSAPLSPVLRRAQTRQKRRRCYTAGCSAPARRILRPGPRICRVRTRGPTV